MNNRRNLSLRWTTLSVFLVAGCILLTWGNLWFTRKYPGGRDFLVHWMGTRIFLTEGISPYSQEATNRLQIAAYGTADSKGGETIRFVSPLYSIVIYLPFAFFLAFETARAVWMTFLEICIIVLVIISIRLTSWKINVPGLFLFLMFSLFWYHAARPLVDGDLAIFTALCLAGCWLSIRAGADELAGVLLAFSTVTPELVILVVVYTLIWGIFCKRWRIISWFFSAVFLLSASAALLMPDWMLQNIRAGVEVLKAGASLNLESAIALWFPAMGGKIGQMVSIVMFALMLIEWWIARAADFPSYLWAACLTLVLSQWIGLPTYPAHFIVLYPALILVLATWEGRWKHLGRPMTFISVFLLFAGLWWLAWPGFVIGYGLERIPIFFIILPAYLFITLYWVRWWAVKPPNVWYDLLLTKENTQR